MVIEQMKPHLLMTPHVKTPASSFPNLPSSFVVTMAPISDQSKQDIPFDILVRELQLYMKHFISTCVIYVYMVNSLYKSFYVFYYCFV